MTDSPIPGEVLVPATRFTPKCECDWPKLTVSLDVFDTGKVVRIVASCDICGSVYDQELLDVGIPHGNARAGG